MLTQPTFLMLDNAIIKPFLGTTPSGPSYGAEYISKCRFEGNRKRMVDSSGKTFFTSGKVFLTPIQANISLERESIIKIDSVSYKVEEKQIMKGFTISHIECVVV